ncbi:DUF1540 domain-containing protein [Thiohalomonas denitrificans]|uniref:DUF1540 domain-containing protein n=1 Tax=Thiohalomonas denitrificans TaxID=415747 RepID=UPI0026F1CD07|nr:DUF1540 domain-containing protein [Thiohalomonas denitrificans]
MEKCIETSDVARCSVPECVYNRSARCYAGAITIGSGDLPECDTFHTANDRVPPRPQTAGVGACKSYECRYNDDYECAAERIYVGWVDDFHFIGCLTYAQTAR